MFQRGMSPTEVAEQLKVGTSRIFHWLARYRAGGWGGLKTGARSGRPKKLDESQMRFVFDLVTNKKPLQLHFPFGLWTCDMIASWGSLRNDPIFEH